MVEDRKLCCYNLQFAPGLPLPYVGAFHGSLVHADRLTPARSTAMDNFKAGIKEIR